MRLPIALIPPDRHRHEVETAQFENRLRQSLDYRFRRPGPESEWRPEPLRQSQFGRLQNSGHLDKLRDPESAVGNQPDYAKNEFRSIRPDVFVAIGICTHLGCVPTYLSTSDNPDEMALYFCPCHGSKFDLAGRVFKNVPAPTNLVVPPHYYIDEDTLKIGEGGNG